MKQENRGDVRKETGRRQNPINRTTEGTQDSGGNYRQRKGNTGRTARRIVTQEEEENAG